jgi:hypothetical protein
VVGDGGVKKIDINLSKVFLKMLIFSTISFFFFTKKKKLLYLKNCLKILFIIYDLIQLCI